MVDVLGISSMEEEDDGDMISSLLGLSEPEKEPYVGKFETLCKESWESLRRPPAKLEFNDGKYRVFATQILYEEPNILIYGFDQNGGSVTVVVNDYKPYFYVRLEDGEELSAATLREGINDYYAYVCGPCGHSSDPRSLGRHEAVEKEIGKNNCFLIGTRRENAIDISTFDPSYSTDGYEGGLVPQKKPFVKIECRRQSVMRAVSRTVGRGYYDYRKKQRIEGHRVYENDQPPEITFMIKRSISGFTWIDIDEDSIREVRNPCTDSSIEIMCKTASVSKSSNQAHSAPLRLATIDFECINRNGTTGFPNPTKEGRLSSIAVRFSKKMPGQKSVQIRSIVFCLKYTRPLPADRAEVVWYDTEAELIKDFASSIRFFQPDEINHYNGKRFDFPFLLARIAVLDIPYSEARMHRHLTVPPTWDESASLDAAVSAAKRARAESGYTDWTATPTVLAPWKHRKKPSADSRSRAAKRKAEEDPPPSDHEVSAQPATKKFKLFDAKPKPTAFSFSDSGSLQMEGNNNNSGNDGNNQDGKKKKTNKDPKPDLESRKEYVKVTHGFDTKVKKFHGIVSLDVLDGVKFMQPNLMSYKLGNVCVDILSTREEKENREALLSTEDLLKRVANGENPKQILNKVAGNNRKEDIPGNLITHIHAEGPASRASLASYNEKDVIVTQAIDDQLMLSENMASICNVAGINVQDVLDSGQSRKGITMLIANCRRREAVFVGFNRQKNAGGNVQAPNGQGKRRKPKFAGAFVVNPVTEGTVGFHRRATGPVDFKSLYPSNMGAFNLCTSTQWKGVNAEARAQAAGLVRDRDYTVTPKGLVFVKKNIWQGIAPQVSDMLVSERRKIQAEMGAMEAAGKKGTTEHTLANIMQNAVKTMANALYGVISLISSEVGESVTSWGVELIKFANSQVKHYKHPMAKRACKVLYGDTDSLYCDLGLDEPALIDDPERNKKLQEYLNLAGEILIGLQDFLNERIAEKAVQSGGERGYLKMAEEGIMYPFLLSTKKRYVALVHDIEKNTDGSPKMVTEPDGSKHLCVKLKGYPKIMGMQTKRRDSCQYAKNVQLKLINCVMEKESPRAAIEYAYNFMRDFGNDKLSFYGFVITKGLTKSIESYNPKPTHVMMAKKMATRDPSSAPLVGDRISYVVIDRPGVEKVGERVELPTIAISEGLPIDKGYYYNNQFLEPIRTIMKSLLYRNDEHNANTSRIKAEWADGSHKLDSFLKRGKFETKKHELPTFIQFEKNMRKLAFQGDNSNSNVMDSLERVRSRPGSVSGDKRVIFDMMVTSGCKITRKCQLCNRVITDADDSEGVVSSFCDDCVKVHTKEKLETSINEKKDYFTKLYKTVWDFCKSCVEKSIGDPAKCEDKDCPVYYTRTLTKVQKEAIEKLNVVEKKKMIMKLLDW